MNVKNIVIVIGFSLILLGIGLVILVVWVVEEMRMVSVLSVCVMCCMWVFVMNVVGLC